MSRVTATFTPARCRAVPGPRRAATGEAPKRSPRLFAFAASASRTRHRTVREKGRLALACSEGSFRAVFLAHDALQRVDYRRQRSECLFAEQRAGYRLAAFSCPSLFDVVCRQRGNIFRPRPPTFLFISFPQKKTPTNNTAPREGLLLLPSRRRLPSFFVRELEHQRSRRRRPHHLFI